MKELLSIEDPIAGLLGAWSAGLNLGSALLRIALIVALAASIGCERSSKRHSAGLRTFVLAAFSATVSMLFALTTGNFRSFAVLPRSIGSPVPASAAEPRGKTLSRFPQSANLCSSRANISANAIK